MAEQTLKITLTADNKQALEGLRQTVTAMNGVQVAAGKTGGAVVKMGSDFTGISRVIQDLPYGFNGIANNLTQLIPAAGLAGVAFSGLVTALTFAQVGFGAWTRGMTQAKQSTEDLNKAINDERLSAEKTVSQLRSLISVAQDQSLSTEQRTTAVKKLQAEYPAYFKGLTVESALTKDLTGVTDQLTAAIYKRAAARAMESDVAAKATTVFQEQQRIEKLTSDLQKATAARQAAEAGKGERRTPTVGQALSGISVIQSGEEVYNKALATERTLFAERDKALTNVSRLTYEIATTQQKINQIGGETILLEEKVTKEKQKQLKAWEQIRGAARETILYNPKDYEQPINPYSKFKTPGRIGGELPIGEQSILGFADNKKQAEDLKNLIALQQEQALTMTNLLAPAFENLFQTMAGGGDIGKALLDSFKQISVQLTAMVVKALLFKIILKSLKLSNPVTAGMELGSGIAGGISGGLSIIGLLRGQDMQLMLDRTSAGNGFRRGG